MGVWNIENLSPTVKRGFPELTGSDRLDPRTDEQLEEIATYIEDDLEVDAIVLTEIHADTGTDAAPRSSQLDLIAEEMGDEWAYILGRTGGKQRIGLVYNKDKVKVKKTVNLTVDEFPVQGKDIFDRDPLIFWITLLEDEEEMNDLFLIGLHLKSQQKFIHNHMAAVARLIGDLTTNNVRQKLGLPKKNKEKDVIIVGDLNDSAHQRQGFNYIFDYLKGVGYAHAGSEQPSYPATRVNSSEIDHIFVSDDLYESAVDAASFEVHSVEQDERDKYRETYSDHFPVTIDLTAYEDDDG